MTDSTGNEVNRYDYDPYGQVINQQEQSGLNNPWKFAGGSLDSSTSLYKFGTRYYDPSLGRWTQQDPVGGSLGDLNAANRYTYANDDPVNVVDPSGRDAIACGLLITAEALVLAALVFGIALSIATLPETVLIFGLMGQELGIVATVITYFGGQTGILAALYAGACS